MQKKTTEENYFVLTFFVRLLFAWFGCDEGASPTPPFGVGGPA